MYHQHPLSPQIADELKDVDGVLCLYPLHHGVQCDEGACPAHTSTAVHQEEVLPAVSMCLPHSLDEVDHGDGIGRNTMVRPGQIVKQSDLKWWGVCFLILIKAVQEKWRERMLILRPPPPFPPHTTWYTAYTVPLMR